MDAKQILLNEAEEYYNNGYSLAQTAQYIYSDFGVFLHPNTLNYQFQKSGIRIRKPREGLILRKRPDVDAANVVREYLTTKSIRNVARTLGLTRPAVRQILIERKIDYLDNSDAIKFANRKYERRSFRDTRKQKAYLFGFVFGDVHVFRKSKFTIRAVTHSTHEAFVRLFENLFAKFGHVHITYKNSNEWCMSIDLDESFGFLEERVNDRLPAWIDDALFFPFLSGLIDSDGSLVVRKAGKYFQFVVKIFGQNIECLRKIAETLGRFDFHPSVCLVHKKGYTHVFGNKVIRYNKDYYELTIHRKSEVLRLLELLTLKHKEKIRRRNQIINIHRQGFFRWRDIKQEVKSLRRSIKQQVELRMHSS